MYSLSLNKNYLSMGKKKRFIQLLKQGTLYGIVGNEKNFKSCLEKTEKILAGGAEIIQYREKNKTLEEMCIELSQLRKITKHYGAFLIVNDYPELCKQVGADGVHLGQNDQTVQSARQLLGESAIIGLSTHCVEDALSAEQLPVDYIGVGPVFKTETKPEKAVAGLKYAHWVVGRGLLPAVAIGGINRENLMQVLATGLRSVCMIGALQQMENITQTVSGVIQMIQNSPENKVFSAEMEI